MSEAKLGESPATGAERDAIHVAILPVVAGERLHPGQHVGMLSKNTVGSQAEHVGIVDPYLKVMVNPGEPFWLCLYPQSVTGMRHHWQHPKIDEKPVDTKSESEAWLRDAAVKLGVSYDDLISEWSPLVDGDYINNGEHIHDIWYDICDDFWKHYEVVTGREVREINRGGFTCSC